MSPAPTATIKIDGWENHPERHGAMFDLAASEDVELREGEAKVIPLGVRMKLPEGYFGLVVPRSSTCLKHGIMMANSVGIIEPDYCGDSDVWGFVAYAIRDTVIAKGMRIAQFMPVPMFGDLDFDVVDSMPYADRGGYGSTGEKAGKHVLDRNGDPIYAGSYVHTTYGNQTKRVAQVFAEGEAFELESGTVVDERNSVKSAKILYQDGGWDRATSVYVVNGTMNDALRTISCLERENKRLKVENEQLKAEIERLRSEVPGDCMSLPLDADGVPIRIGDESEVDGDAMTVLGYRFRNDMLLIIAKDKESGLVFTPDPSRVRHCKPEPPDSWDKLEEDALKGSCTYFGKLEELCTACPHGKEISGRGCMKNMKLDLIERAKRLAGIEEQEGGERTAIADKEER